MSLLEPREALSSACAAAAELRWRLAVLSDCYTQHDEAGGAATTGDAADLLGKIDACLESLDGRTSAG